MSDLHVTVGERVRTLSKITPGTEVCVVTSQDADHRVGDVLVAVARQMGGQVTRIEIPPFSRWRGTFRLPRPAENAIRGCQVLLSYPYMQEAMFCWNLTVVGALLDYGIKHITFFGPVDCLTGPAMDWPDELSFVVEDKLSTMLFQDTVHVRVRDDKGTDFEFEGDPDWAHPTWGEGLRREQPLAGRDWRDAMTIFPRGEVGWQPYGTARGVVRFDGMSTYGMLREPIEYVVENGAIAAIQGGDEAEHFRVSLEQCLRPGQQLTINEASLGFNPKCRWNTTDPSLTELYMRAGTFHIAVGMSTLKVAPKHAVKTHVDGILLRPDVEVNGVPILRGGRLLLLDEIRKREDVRAAASAYGDPDLLLLNEYGGMGA